MRLFRCFPWEREVGERARGGALWFPRMLQGAGRHDNPELYGCLYVAVDPLSAVVEHLAPFRNSPALEPWMFRFAGLPLALATIVTPDGLPLVDLDEPRVLAREGLRPSLVATGERARTQAYAADLFERHSAAGGLRWWSAFESQWLNVTLFDRAASSLGVAAVELLTIASEVVGEAARALGLRRPST